METSLTSSQLASAAGLTLRQIQWWDEQGVMRVRRHGHSRQFTRGDAMVYAVLSQLRRRRFSLQRLRGTLPTLKRLLLQQASYTDRYLVFTSKPAIVHHSTLAKTLSLTTVPSYVLDLGEIAESVDSAVETG